MNKPEEKPIAARQKIQYRSERARLKGEERTGWLQSPNAYPYPAALYPDVK